MQSRYYDPDVKRFINTDSLISIDQEFLGNNLYTYCGNNPITYVDYTGNRFVRGNGGSSESLKYELDGVNDEGLRNYIKGKSEPKTKVTSTKKDNSKKKPVDLPDETYDRNNYKNYIKYNSTNRPHSGNDIAAPKNTPIISVTSGYIHSKEETESGYGKHIVVRSFENGEPIYFIYAHMNKFGKYNVGDYIPDGTVIGYVGSTGNSTGYHLHFEVSITADINKKSLDKLNKGLVKHPKEYIRWID